MSIIHKVGKSLVTVHNAGSFLPWLFSPGPVQLEGDGHIGGMFNEE